MYTNRKKLYKNLERERASKVLVYITGDRPGLETQISTEVSDILIHHLDKMDCEKISLYLYTRGGDALASWSIANLIRQFCKKLEVVIPSKCHSGGTLITLAADSIVMTKQATLGPIDPSITTPLNPSIVGAQPQARAPVSVEAINGFFEMSKEFDKATTIPAFNILAQVVHPLVLGQARRTRAQIRMLGERLLSHHIKDKGKIDKIIAFLCSDSGSHDYTINRREAVEQLDLKVEKPSQKLYNLIKSIYDDISQELELGSRFEPQVLLAGQTTASYRFPRALVESISGGSHQFVTEGVLSATQTVPPQAPQLMIQDNRKFEGWKHVNKS